MLKTGGWYLLKNGLVIGPVERTRDINYPYWCPRFNFRVYLENGIQSKSHGMTDPYDIEKEVDSQKFAKIYKQIEKEFNFFTAAITCGMFYIHLEKEIEYKHLISIGSFTYELLKEFNSKFHWLTLSSSDSKCLDDALSCWKVLYDWECKESLHGLGGCKKATFKQLIKELDEIQANMNY